MTNETKLEAIKALHTLIWVFFNTVIFYMLYAVLVNRFDIWLWIGFGLVLLEGLVLLLFRWTCPLTLVARQYSSSKRNNFDIYLPNRLAKYTKTIYTSLAIIIVVIAVVRILQNEIFATTT